MKKILCWLGFHDDKLEYVVVHKTKFTETANSRWVCKRCGRETAWTGGTSFGPISIEVKK